MKTYKIYRYWIEIDGEEWSYVGCTSKTLIERAGSFKSLIFYKDNPKFWEAIQKYGAESFNHEIIWETSDEDEAWELEQMTIEILKSIDYGFNLSTGGRSGSKGVHYSEEFRQQLSEQRRGEKHPQWGKHLSEITKKKISVAHKGKSIPQKWKSIIQYTSDGDYVATYSSVTEAVQKTGISQASISSVLIGRNKTAGGYHWAYQLD